MTKQVISITLQKYNHSQNCMLHLSLGETDSYRVGYGSIDVCPHSDGIALESPTFRTHTQQYTLDWFIKFFPICQDLILTRQCKNLAQFLIALPKIRNFEYKFFLAFKDDSDSLICNESSLNDLLFELV